MSRKKHAAPEAPPEGPEADLLTGADGAPADLVEGPGGTLPDDEPGAEHAWSEGAQLVFLCNAPRDRDGSSADLLADCARLQRCAPPGAAGGITSEEARAIGWTIDEYRVHCPMCAERERAAELAELERAAVDAHHETKWNGSAWVRIRRTDPGGKA